MIKKISLSIVSTVLAFSFAACGETSENPTATVTVTESATAETDSGSGRVSDEQFVELVKSETDSFDSSSTSDLVEAAQAVCDLWDAGAGIEQMFSSVLDSGVDASDGGFLVGAATANYCPEYADKIEGLGSNA